jgi:hypothetical protein
VDSLAHLADVIRNLNYLDISLQGTEKLVWKPRRSLPLGNDECNPKVSHGYILVYIYIVFIVQAY